MIFISMAAQDRRLFLEQAMRRLGLFFKKKLKIFDNLC